MTQQPSQYLKPNAVDRFINRAFGLLVRIGLGLRHNYLLQVRGRKTGLTYSTPVNLLERSGKKYLVAPRGYTQWVRNVMATGEATLIKGSKREEVRLRAMPDEEKPELLKDYLDRYRPTVQRYFPVAAGSASEVFEPLAAKYPVFEVIPK